jgi:AcrR family transcriptional regulator
VSTHLLFKRERTLSTRDRILDGAAQVMRERGVANTTTKEIARAAGFSEATLYKIFEDKIDIFLAVLNERLGRQPGRPNFTLVREGPTAQLRRRTVQRNLEIFAAEALLFYAEVFPIGASLFSDPDVLARYREALEAESQSRQIQKPRRCYWLGVATTAPSCCRSPARPPRRPWREGSQPDWSARSCPP